METNIGVISPSGFEIIIKTADGHECTRIMALGGVMVTRDQTGNFQGTAFGNRVVVADATAAAPWVLREQANDLGITDEVGIRIKAGMSAKHLSTLFDLL